MNVTAGTLPGFHWGELMATCHQHCQLVITTSTPLPPPSAAMGMVGNMSTHALCVI